MIRFPPARRSPSAAAKAARATLADVLADARREREALDVLRAGRARLAERIADAERRVAADHAEAEAEAAGVIDAIKRGGDFVLSFVRATREAPPDLTVARLALERADREIASAEAQLARSAERVPSAVAAILRAEAASHADAYSNALAAAAEAAARLAGLAAYFDPAEGGRIVMVAPGFPLAGDDLDQRAVAIEASTIRAASADWRRFAAALASDPDAEAARFVTGPLKSADADPPPYESLSDVERRIIDLKFSPFA